MLVRIIVTRNSSLSRMGILSLKKALFVLSCLKVRCPNMKELLAPLSGDNWGRQIQGPFL